MASIRPTASAAAAQLLRTVSAAPITRRPMLSAAAAPAMRRLESSLTPATPQAAARVAPSTADNSPDYAAATDRATSYVALFRPRVERKLDAAIDAAVGVSYNCVDC